MNPMNPMNRSNPMNPMNLSFVALLGSDSVQKKVFIQFGGSSGFGQRSEQRSSFSFVVPLGSGSVQKKCSFSFVVPQDSVNVQSNGVHLVLWPLLCRTASEHPRVLQCTLFITIPREEAIETQEKDS